MNKKEEQKREYCLGYEEVESEWWFSDLIYFVEAKVLIEGRNLSVVCRCGFMWSMKEGGNSGQINYRLEDLVDMDIYKNCLARLFRIIRKGNLGVRVDKFEWLPCKKVEYGLRSNWDDAEEYQDKYTELIESLMSEVIQTFGI